MTRAEVFEAIRSALASRGSPPLNGPTTFPLRTFTLDPVTRFQTELKALDGECEGPVQDWRPAVRGVAARWGCEAVFPAPRLDNVGLALADRARAERDPDRVLGLARAAHGIAETGSVVIDGDGAHIPTALTAASVVLLDPARIVWGIEHLAPAPQTVRCRVLVTGPSRTADIEKQIVLGAHGPRRLMVLLAP